MTLREEESVNLMMLLHIWFLRLQGFDDQTDQVQDLVGKVYGGTKELGT